MGMRFVEVPCKSVLNRLPHERYIFRYSINLYRGCRHACPFCYARYTHWFLGYERPADFEEVIEVKSNALGVLAAELGAPGWTRELVSLGTATDNYQPAEKQYRLTRGALQLCTRFRTPVVFSTKSDLVVRDCDVLAALNRAAYVGAAVTVTTLDPRLQRFLEPHAVSVERRFRALRLLQAHGIPTGIHIMPILPYLTDSRAALEGLFRAARDLGVDYVVCNTLRLQGGMVRSFFFRRLAACDPALLRRYQQLYRNRGEPPEEYRRSIAAMIRALRHQYGVSNGERFFRRRAAQLSLFGQNPEEAGEAKPDAEENLTAAPTATAV